MNDNTTFNPEWGQIEKSIGMGIAADERQESLNAARAYLVKLALEGDLTVTADDARRFIQDSNLRPLGNAAGSLFRQKHWKPTGERRQSAVVSNHAHSNRVWTLDIDRFIVGQ